MFPKPHQFEAIGTSEGGFAPLQILFPKSHVFNTYESLTLPWLLYMLGWRFAPPLTRKKLVTKIPSVKHLLEFVPKIPSVKDILEDKNLFPKSHQSNISNNLFPKSHQSNILQIVPKTPSVWSYSLFGGGLRPPTNFVPKIPCILHHNQTTASHQPWAGICWGGASRHP